MLAFITNLGPSEFVLVLVLAVLIFGRRLPEVAAKGAVHLQRFRRGVQDFRRESGFDDEIRRARQLVEHPIKSALKDADREPAAWRPPSPRVAPHPDADEEAEEEEEEAPSAQPEAPNEEEPETRS